MALQIRVDIDDSILQHGYADGVDIDDVWCCLLLLMMFAYVSCLSTNAFGRSLLQSPLSYKTMLVTRFLLHGYMRPRWTTWIGPMPIVFSANSVDEKTYVSNKHDLCLAGKMLDRGTFQKQSCLLDTCVFSSKEFALNTDGIEPIHVVHLGLIYLCSRNQVTSVVLYERGDCI